MNSSATIDTFGTTAIYSDGFLTHLDPDCPRAEGPTERVGYEGRGQIACFRCVDVAPNRDGMADEIATRPVGPASQGQALDQGEVDRAVIENIPEWLLGLGRKVDVSDMSLHLQRAATTWAKDYAGDFGFMLDMQQAAEKRQLTRGQGKGVLNCWRAQLQRDERDAKQAEAGQDALGSSSSVSEGVDLSNVPAGRYIAPGGSRRFKLDAPAKGKWAGWVFVKTGSFYADEERLGSQKPGQPVYRGRHADELAKIAADPKAAAAEWGRQTSTCGVCGRPLEDDESVARGIGPVCAKRF